MFKNYLKITIRNLTKHRVYSFINLTGLAIGLSSFLLITLYVVDELSYDRFYPKAAQIYRVNSDIKFGGNEMQLPVTSDMMGSTMKKDFPQVQEYTRLYTSGGSKMLRKGNSFVNEEKVAHADSTFFSVFELPVLHGNTSTALNEPNTVVISRSAAVKYFQKTDCVGESLLTERVNDPACKITAVIEDMPSNAHFNFDFIFSMDNVNYEWGNFLSHNFHTYLLLKEGTDPKIFDAHFKQYIRQYVLPQAKQAMQIESLEQFESSGNKLKYSLIPITKIHLYSTRMFEIGPTGNIQYVYIFSAVAIFILLIACINFMNLTTAKSAGRAREVGIRKVLGTERKNLIYQFLSESVVMAVLSFGLAILVSYLMLPVFNNLANKTLGFGILLTPSILPWIILLPIVVGCIAGSYPAFYLSGFRPIEVLKGKLKVHTRGVSLRSILVVFQFATSLILITATIVIYSQLNYIQSKNLGFKKDQVLIINNANALRNSASVFKQQMLQVPGVTIGTLSGFLPVNSSRSDESFFSSPTIDVENGFNMQHWYVDYDYVKTMGMEIVKGRNFSKEFGSDSSAILINESTARLLGHEDPIGKKVYTLQDIESQIVNAFTIVGVVKNFHYESLRQDIGPLSMRLGESNWNASFRIDAANASSVIEEAEKKWKSLAPAIPFSYAFMDDSFDEMYRTEQRVGTIAIVFSVLAIFIACLGLFALATFVAEQRTKEIGIRKVLGASVNGITSMLASNFAKLVIVSILIGTPLAWYLMYSWLQEFAYRIDLNWLVFAGAGLIVLMIAMLTVSFQAMKAALMNPIKSLRAE